MDETFEFQAASFKSNLREHENFRIKFRPVLRHAMQHSTEVREQRRKFRAPGVPQFKYIYTHIYFFPIFSLVYPVPRFSSVPPAPGNNTRPYLRTVHRTLVMKGVSRVPWRNSRSSQKKLGVSGNGKFSPCAWWREREGKESSCIKFYEQSISPPGSFDNPSGQFERCFENLRNFLSRNRNTAPLHQR